MNRDFAAACVAAPFLGIANYIRATDALPPSLLYYLFAFLEGYLILFFVIIPGIALLAFLEKSPDFDDTFRPLIYGAASLAICYIFAFFTYP